MQRMAIRADHFPRRLRCAAALIALTLGASQSVAAGTYWADKTRVVGFAAIALNREMADKYRRNAVNHAYWGDPEPCARLFSDYLDRLEAHLATHPDAALPGALADLLPFLDAPERLPDERIFAGLDIACSKRGVREYGTWCNDLLGALGMTPKDKHQIRLAGARAFLADAAAGANPSCPRTAAEGGTWLASQIASPR